MKNAHRDWCLDYCISFLQYSSEGEEEEDVLADPNNIGYKTKPKKV